jgi:predicted ATP-grasp superfamily ATP-dependent carboligase
VVVGLDNITGLQTARILAGRGVPVVGLVDNPRHFGARTNACAEIITADCSSEGLVEALANLGERLGRTSVLLPCTDPAVSILSRHRARLEDRFVLPLAPHDVVETLMNKLSFARYADEAGLAAPHTEVLSNRGDAEAASRRVRYPSVLKPALKSQAWAGHTSAKGFRVGDVGEMLAVYDQVAGWSPQLLLQEWVEGGEEGLFSCNCYFDRQGQPLVTFVARKVRQWPPDIGTSASGVECRNDDVLTETLKVFGGLGFHGLAYLEMKRDTRTGRLQIIEPNVGRPTGRSAIAEAAGVELVYTAYCDAAGLPLPATREQQFVGTKWLDLRRDLQAAVVARRRGDLSIREWGRSVRGPKAHAIWSRRDPMPFAVDVVQATVTGGRLASARVARSVRERVSRYRPRPPSGSGP